MKKQQNKQISFFESLKLARMGVPYYEYGGAKPEREYALAALIRGEDVGGYGTAIRRGDFEKAVCYGRLRRAVRPFTSWGGFVRERVPELRNFSANEIEKLLLIIIRKATYKRNDYALSQDPLVSRELAKKLMNALTEAGVWVPVMPFPHVKATGLRKGQSGLLFDSGIAGELLDVKDYIDMKEEEKYAVFRTALVSDLLANLSATFPNLEYWYFKRNQTLIDLIIKINECYHPIIIWESDKTCRCPSSLWNLTRNHTEGLNWGDAFIIYHGAEVLPLSVHYIRGWFMPFDAYVKKRAIDS